MCHLKNVEPCQRSQHLGSLKTKRILDGGLPTWHMNSGYRDKEAAQVGEHVKRVRHYCQAMGQVTSSQFGDNKKKRDRRNDNQDPLIASDKLLL